MSRATEQSRRGVARAAPQNICDEVAARSQDSPGNSLEQKPHYEIRTSINGLPSPHISLHYEKNQLPYGFVAVTSHRIDPPDAKAPQEEYEAVDLDLDLPSGDRYLLHFKGIRLPTDTEPVLTAQQASTIEHATALWSQRPVFGEPVGADDPDGLMLQALQKDYATVLSKAAAQLEAKATHETERQRRGSSGKSGSPARTKKQRNGTTATISGEEVADAAAAGDFLYVCCDRCSKWRRLPDHYRLEQPKLPKKWFCEMNPDCSRARCSVSEEAALSPIVRYADQFCSLCYGATSDQPGMLLLHCRGPCMRSFHEGCVEMVEPASAGASYDMLTSSERPTPTDWYCQDCLLDTHRCFQCGVMGRHSIDIFKCPAVCGKFFHPDCLDYAPAPEMTGDPQSTPPRWASNSPGHARSNQRYRHGARGSEALALRRYTTSTGFSLCPHHSCSACGKSRRSYAEAGFARCAKCPAAFHLTARCRPSDLIVLTNDSFLCASHAQNTPGKASSRTTATQSPPSAAEAPGSNLSSPPFTLSSFSSKPIKSSPFQSSNMPRFRLFRLTSETAGRFPALVSMLASASVPTKQLIFPQAGSTVGFVISPGLPFRCGNNLTLLSLGRIVLSPRFYRSSPVLVYPVGFKSAIKLNSFIESSQQTLYITEITTKTPQQESATKTQQHGEQPATVVPWFRVTASDAPKEVFEAETPTKVWELVKARIASLLGSRATYSLAAKLPTQGEDTMGLTEPVVQDLIAQLPNARFCPAYANRTYDQDEEAEEEESELEEQKDDTEFAEEAFQELAKQAATNMANHKPTQMDSSEGEDGERKGEDGEGDGERTGEGEEEEDEEHFSRGSSPIRSRGVDALLSIGGTNGARADDEEEEEEEEEQTRNQEREQEDEMEEMEAPDQEEDEEEKHATAPPDVSDDGADGEQEVEEDEAVSDSSEQRSDWTESPPSSPGRPKRKVDYLAELASTSALAAKPASSVKRFRKR
eukprot:gb/GEZN01001286.1/.p1 GENE.gb/GEZN01001286.1/~~gb/GEZN01001286.1/.p1  ORF type:complete len:993 (+),score=193.98 gb/GEZN01001286.1/:30-2981(+)